ncbi:MAG: hypothetical protein WCP57_10730 [Bacteroidota bacterium]
MKKYLFAFLLISTTIFAQTSQDKNKSELLTQCTAEKEKLSNEKIGLEKKLNERMKKDSICIDSLRSIIINDNKYWLKGLLDEKYTVSYFLETDLESTDISERIIKSNVYIQSIRAVELDGNIIAICNQALDFNENYKTLFEIKNSILNKKYDEEKVNDAISRIERLPQLKPNSKLDTRKNTILNALKNYLPISCDLKKRLDRFKDADCKTSAMQLEFYKLENDPHYTEYDYLRSIIRKMKNNAIDYTNNDLQSCE